MKHFFCATTILMALTTVFAGGAPCLAQAGSRPGGIPISDIVPFDWRGIEEAEKELKASNLCLGRDALQEAAAHFQKSIEARPLSSGYVGLMLANVELRNYRGAVAAYRAVLDDLKSADFSNDLRVQFAYALALSKTGQDAEALEVCRRAVELVRSSSPDRIPVPFPGLGGNGVNRFVSRPLLQAIAHTGIALSASWTSPTEQQINHARMAAQTQPNSGWAHYYYGRALVLRVGTETKAADWEKAWAAFALAGRLGNDATKKEVEAFKERFPSVLK